MQTSSKGRAAQAAKRLTAAPQREYEGRLPESEMEDVLDACARDARARSCERSPGQTGACINKSLTLCTRRRSGRRGCSARQRWRRCATQTRRLTGNCAALSRCGARLHTFTCAHFDERTRAGVALSRRLNRP
eukprot:6201300-Pleurochrysis_carterae.AAC.2